VLDHQRDLLDIAACRGDLREGVAVAAAQDAVADLAHGHWGKHRDVLRRVKQPCEPQERVDHLIVQSPHKQAPLASAGARRSRRELRE
jgi:hypothetical protein